MCAQGSSPVKFSIPDSTVWRAVYPCEQVGVNRPRANSFAPAGLTACRGPTSRSMAAPQILATLPVLAVLLILAASGCARSVKVTSHPYLVAVRYDVEPVFAAHGFPQAMDVIQGDFATIAEFGFPTALLQHIDPMDHPALLEGANEAGVRVILPVADAGFAQGGKPLGSQGSGKRMRTGRPAPPGWCTHPAFAGLVSRGSFGPILSAQAGVLSLNSDENGMPWIGRVAQADPGEPRPAALATLDTRALPLGSENSLLEGYLAWFHAGLASGQTGGLIVDRYRRPSGDPPGVIAPGEEPSPARAAAIKKLVDRARHWGPRLCRLAAQPVADRGENSTGFQVTALVGERRRYVLVFNPSLDRYGRGEVRLPELIAGVPAARAVEVPPSTSAAAGRVIDARGGRLTIPVTLRPGDAALFEVF